MGNRNQQTGSTGLLQKQLQDKSNGGHRTLKWATGTAAAAALYLASGTSAPLNADIIHNASGFTNNTAFEWDVDGNGGNDFLVEGGLYSSSSYSTVWFQVNLKSHGGRNGRGMINFGAGSTDDDVMNLPQGFKIGGALANGYAWGASGQSDRNLITAYATTSNATTSGTNFFHYLGQDVQGFNLDQSGYIGFRFESAGDLLYGWARVTLNTSPDYGSLTVHEWAYNDTAGGSIQVGQTSAVPEPGSLIGLAALACGAAGLRRTRRKRNMD